MPAMLSETPAADDVCHRFIDIDYAALFRAMRFMPDCPRAMLPCRLMPLRYH